MVESIYSDAEALLIPGFNVSRLIGKALDNESSKEGRKKAYYHHVDLLKERLYTAWNNNEVPGIRFEDTFVNPGTQLTTFDWSFSIAKDGTLTLHFTLLNQGKWENIDTHIRVISGDHVYTPGEDSLYVSYRFDAQLKRIALTEGKTVTRSTPVGAYAFYDSDGNLLPGYPQKYRGPTGYNLFPLTKLPPADKEIIEKELAALPKREANFPLVVVVNTYEEGRGYFADQDRHRVEFTQKLEDAEDLVRYGIKDTLGRVGMMLELDVMGQLKDDVIPS